MIARLYRMLPLVVVLAVVAGIVYLVAACRNSPLRAKEIVIAMFTWITGILSAFFLLVLFYAWAEGNAAVADLALGFLVVSLGGLAIVRVCRRVFLKRHPERRHKPMKATREARFPWSILQQLLQKGRK